MEKVLLDEIRVSTDNLTFVVARERRTRSPKFIAPQLQSERIIKIAQKRGWDDVRVIGHGWIEHPIENNGWLVMSLDTYISIYKGIIPEVGLDRVETLTKLKEPNKGLLVADDLRKFKPKPLPSQNRQFTSSFQDVAVPVAAGALVVGATVAVGLLEIALSVLAFDPMLILITEEYQWISLYEWFE